MRSIPAIVAAGLMLSLTGCTASEPALPGTTVTIQAPDPSPSPTASTAPSSTPASDPDGGLATWQQSDHAQKAWTDGETFLTNLLTSGTGDTSCWESSEKALPYTSGALHDQLVSDIAAMKTGDGCKLWQDDVDAGHRWLVKIDENNSSWTKLVAGQAMLNLVYWKYVTDYPSTDWPSYVQKVSANLLINEDGLVTGVAYCADTAPTCPEPQPV